MSLDFSKIVVKVDGRVVEVGTSEIPILAINNGQGVTTWNDIQGKPSMFPPSPHDHNGYYYTKTEINSQMAAKQNLLEFDSYPTADSKNPVRSMGIKTVLDAKQDALVFDNTPTANSNNPVKSKGIKTALDAKQDALVFDNTPTANSNNPVKSKGIKTALDGINIALDTKQNTLTFDEIPMTNSINPVKSGGIKTVLDDLQDTKADIIISTVSGNPAIIPDGMDSALVDLLIGIEPYQEGDGDPSPSNVRAVSGYMGGYLTVNGDSRVYEWQSQAGTVYGGTYDLTTGVLTVTMVSVTLTSCIGIVSGSGNNGIANLIYSTKPPVDTSTPTKVKASYLKTMTATELWQKVNYSIATRANGNIVAYLDGSLTKEQFDAYLAAHPLQVVYELATPLTYQVDSEVVRILAGENTISAETGPVTIQYRADTKAYIDRHSTARIDTLKTMIASVETDFIATRNYNKEDYFFVGDQLYIASAGIGIGQAIVPLSNAMEITLSGYLSILIDAFFNH